MTMLIVRRGLSSTYHSFLHIFASTRGLAVTIDRRTGDRRCGYANTSDDRRAGERRGPPPRTWDRADFIAVEPPDE